ncbi:integrase catalytic domain-containing protein [Nephila pilipes]|uniref:Integrase catalytic domain-containing protein n=1 Tax=Nephila pilipes TaxID=299642 RepID=A0A8X6NKD5_NEPPI|nr:integrase catalytic domain-containing protein [Nephila pilipes]
MNYPPLRCENVVHSYFGREFTNEFKHKCYKVKLRSLYGNCSCSFEVLDQSTICENIRSVFKHPSIKEVEENKITEEDVRINDIRNSCEVIDILIGADVMGKMLTCESIVSSPGLVAVEIYL